MIKNLSVSINGVLYTEEWKPVKGYEDLYSISSFGRILSFHNNKNVLLKQAINQKGYWSVVLYKNRKFKGLLVHRLVAIAFIPNHKNNPLVNHIDAVRTNCHVSNLEWCTHQYNVDHAKAMSTLKGKKYNMIGNQRTVKSVIAFKDSLLYW